jgi:hypothetical protein
MAKKAKRFRVPDPFVLLEFDGSLEGLWVKVRRDPKEPGTYRELAGLVDLGDLQAAKEVLGIFGRAFLIDWNADNADGPVPATAEGFASLSTVSQMAIVERWFKELSGQRILEK